MIIKPGTYGVIRILFDSADFYSQDLLKEVTGVLEIESDDETKTVDITMKIIGDVPDKIDTFYDEFNALDDEIEDLGLLTNVNTFYNKLNNLRKLMYDAREYYEDGDYERSVMTVNNIETGITELKNEIRNTNKN